MILRFNFRLCYQCEISCYTCSTLANMCEIYIFFIYYVVYFVNLNNFQSQSSLWIYNTYMYGYIIHIYMNTLFLTNEQKSHTNIDVPIYPEN